MAAATVQNLVQARFFAVSSKLCLIVLESPRLARGLVNDMQIGGKWRTQAQKTQGHKTQGVRTQRHHGDYRRCPLTILFFAQSRAFRAKKWASVGINGSGQRRIWGIKAQQLTPTIGNVMNRPARGQEQNAGLQFRFGQIWIAGPSLGVYDWMNRKTTHATLE